MDAHLERAFILIEQSRYELAEQELRQTLARHPDNPLPHAILAICLAQRDNHREATQEAED